MAEDAHHRVVLEDAGESVRGFGGAVGDDDLTGVLGESDADPAAVVEADPACSGCDVGGEVEEWPIGDGVGAVFHGFGFAVWGCDGAAVKVVAADDDRSGDGSRLDHVVEQQSRFVTLSESEPADSAWESLERESWFAVCEVLFEQRFRILVAAEDPLVESFVVSAVFLWEELEDGVVCFVDVDRVAGECTPAERSASETELWTDVCWNKSGECEGFFETLVERALADVVAVVKGD